jgi:hypothetical protein
MGPPKPRLPTSLPTTFPPPVCHGHVLVCGPGQDMMVKRLAFNAAPECSILEVKTVEGLGTTIDVVLVNGTLRKTDTIVVCGMQVRSNQLPWSRW